jgi:hypothetical protein
MNPSKALDWILENDAEKEPQEDAVDLKVPPSSGAGYLQCSQEVASNISRSLAYFGITGAK